VITGLQDSGILDFFSVYIIFIYEPILIKISNIKTQIFLKIKNDLRGHSRSYKVILNFQNHLFLRYNFCLTPIFLNFSGMSTLWCRNFFIKWIMTSKVIQGHKRPILCENHSSTFVYGPILMKFCMNTNIMKTQYMTSNITFILWRSYAIFFTLRPFVLIKALTYFLWTTFVLVLLHFSPNYGLWKSFRVTKQIKFY
jgi:hypothetical protein